MNNPASDWIIGTTLRLTLGRIEKEHPQFIAGTGAKFCLAMVDRKIGVLRLARKKVKKPGSGFNCMI